VASADKILRRQEKCLRLAQAPRRDRAPRKKSRVHKLSYGCKQGRHRVADFGGRFAPRRGRLSATFACIAPGTLAKTL